MSSPEVRPGIPDEEVWRELDRVASSRTFQNSERMVRFVRFVVEKTLAGEPDAIKEYTLGVEVFDRSEDFDPKTDTIVRVEARRLRRKLKEYYEGDGAADPIRIDVPSPGYAPVFTAVPVATAPEIAPVPEELPRSIPPVPARPVWKWWAVLAVSAVIGVGAAVWLFRSPAHTELSSVAVLPFANLSGDPKQEYFCDGFTEELIDRLSSINNLRVVARTSVFEYKDKPKDVREIGRKLGVDSLVEGSVRRDGDVVRITAQLVRTGDGYHVWSRTWDRQLSDVLAVQSDVAQAIADTVRRPMPVRPTPPLNIEAYDLYLLGRSHWNRMSPEELPKSIVYFEQAIAKDPRFALAYSGMSEAYSYMMDLDFAPPREIAVKAKDAAEKALALDDTLAEAHTSRGLVAYDVEWNVALADREFRRAIELKPSYAYGIHWYAHFLDSRDKLPEAEREMKWALQLDPLSRMLQLDVGMIEYKKRNYAAAWAALHRVRELDPEYFFSDFSEASIYLAQGNAQKAVGLLRRSRQKVGDEPLILALLAQAEVASGDRTAARGELATLERMAKTQYVPASAFALTYYALGEQQEGLRWLHRASEDRSGMLLFMKNSPAADIMRRDPAAAALLDRMGDAKRQ